MMRMLGGGKGLVPWLSYATFGGFREAEKGVVGGWTNLDTRGWTDVYSLVYVDHPLTVQVGSPLESASYEKWSPGHSFVQVRP